MVYKRKKRLNSFYSGGKICVIPFNRTPDNPYIACLNSGTVNFVDINARKPVKAVTIAEEEICCFDAKNSTLVTTTKSGMAKAWDLAKGVATQTLPVKMGLTAQIELHPKLPLAAFIDYNGRIQIYSLQTTSDFKLYKTHSFNTATLPEKMAFSAVDSMSLFVGMKDGRIQIFDLRPSAKKNKCLAEHSSAVTDLKFFLSDKSVPTFLSCSRDGSVCVFEGLIGRSNMWKVVKRVKFEDVL